MLFWGRHEAIEARKEEGDTMQIILKSVDSHRVTDGRATGRAGQTADGRRDVQNN